VPTYRIRAPDGRVIRIQAPDPQTATRGAQEWAESNPAKDDLIGQFGRGVAQGVGGLMDTVRQATGNPEGMLRAAGVATDNIAGYMRSAFGQGVAPPKGNVIGQMAAAGAPDSIKAFRQQMTPAPVTEPGRIAETAGTMLPNAFMGGGGVVRRAAQVAIPALASEGARAGAQALGGGPLAQGAAQVAGAVAGGAASSLRPNAFMPRGSQAAQALAAENIPLTVGQKAGGVAKTIEDKATSLPIVGDAITGARKRGFDALNRAVANRALAPIGETLPAEVATGNDAVAHVQARLGVQYDKAASLIKGVDPTDPDFTAAIKARAASLADAPQDVQDAFAKTVQNRVLGPLSSGSASGTQVGSISSDLGSMASDFVRQGGYGAQLGRALDGVGDDVQALAAKQNPDYATAKSAADEGWANFVRMRQAAASQGAKNGVFTPAQLKMAVRSNDDSVGKGATARGDSLLFDLANNADTTMGSNYPDSGTTGRLILNSMALGSLHPATAGVGAPTLAGLGAAAVPYALSGRGVPNAFANVSPEAVKAAIEAVKTPRSVTALDFSGLPANVGNPAALSLGANASGPGQ